MPPGEIPFLQRRSFWEHLDALRKMIIRIAIIIAGISVFCFVFDIKSGYIGGIGIVYPYPDILHPIASQVFLRISHDLLPEGVRVVSLTPWAAMMIQFEISIMLGIFLGMPMIVNEIGKFLGPALRIQEKQLILKLALPSGILFLLGVMFAYAFILPFSINFMYQFAAAMGAEQLFTIDEFMNFILMMTFAFGIIAETPVIIVGLSSLGIVSPQFWIKHWRWAAMISLTFGAIITPDGTGITMMMVAIPMITLYFSGCAIAMSNNKMQTIGLILAFIGCSVTILYWLNPQIQFISNEGAWLLLAGGIATYATGMFFSAYSLIMERKKRKSVN